MKIIVLGGSGFVGREVVKDLLGNNAVKEVCIGDYNLKAAEALAKEIGAKATARFVDVTEPSGLLCAVKGYDLAVNVVGPFYRNGARVLDACLASKVHYVDTCDDYDACDLLLGYDEKCKQAGITAIISSGASPGITNMLGMLGVTKMDQAEEIHTSWVENIADAGGVVVWWHGVHMANGDVPQFIDGQWVKVPALTGKVDVTFAEPLGKWPVYYLGHPEPVTLPRYIKGIKTVTNRGNTWPAEADLGGFSKAFADLGLYRTEALSVGDVEVNIRDFTVNYMLKLATEVPLPAPTPGDPHFLIRVDVRGKTGKSEVRYVYNGQVGDTSKATAVSASYCAQEILSGKVSQKGAIAPEGCIEPNNFFKYIAERGVCFSETKTVTEFLVV